MPKYSDEWLEDYVFDCCDRMYLGYTEQVTSLPDEDYLEVSYEDLVKAPLTTLEQIYQKFDLGGFDEAKPALEKFASLQKDYQPNRHQQEHGAPARSPLPPAPAAPPATTLYWR